MKLIEYNKQINDLYDSNNEFVNNAKSFDKKWIRKEQKMCDKKLIDVYDYSMLKYHNGYDDRNPYQIQREHPLSWRWKSTDIDGLPLNSTAAGKV